MLYSGYVLFNAISHEFTFCEATHSSSSSSDTVQGSVLLPHYRTLAALSHTIKAERILTGRFEHNSLERLAAASGCMSSVTKFENSRVLFVSAFKKWVGIRPIF